MWEDMRQAEAEQLRTIDFYIQRFVSQVRCAIALAVLTRTYNHSIQEEARASFDACSQASSAAMAQSWDEMAKFAEPNQVSRLQRCVIGSMTHTALPVQPLPMQLEAFHALSHTRLPALDKSLSATKVALAGCRTCDAANEALVVEVDELEAERVMLVDALRKRIHFVENQVCLRAEICSWSRTHEADHLDTLLDGGTKSQGCLARAA